MYKHPMHDETAAQMYESARHRLLELLNQEKESKDHISHWTPIVEQLARKPVLGNWLLAISSSVLAAKKTGPWPSALSL